MDWRDTLTEALLGRSEPVDAGTAAGVVAALGADRLVAVAAERRRTGGAWPWPVERPEGYGAAQWAAVLGAAVREVEHTQGSARVVRQRPPDADEQRLLRDVPPHHLG